MPSRFQDFGRGVITLSGFFYFLGVAAAMLYLNMVLLGRRHWAGGEASGGRWLHSAVRFASVLLALFSVDGPDRPMGRPGLGRPGRRQRGEAQHALDRVARPDQADPGRSAGDDPGVLQPGGPARVRRDQGDPARPAPRIRGQERWQDPARPGADRAVLRGGARRREAVRHRAAQGPFQRPGPADGRGRNPGRRVHLGARGGRHPVLRPRACRPNTS